MQNDYTSTHSGERDPKHTMWLSIWPFRQVLSQAKIYVFAKQSHFTPAASRIM